MANNEVNYIFNISGNAGEVIGSITQNATSLNTTMVNTTNIFDNFGKKSFFLNNIRDALDGLNSALETITTPSADFERSVSLKTLLEDQQTGVPIRVFGEQNIGEFRQTKETVAELLNSLKEQGVRSFFRQDEKGSPLLYCGVLFEKQGERKQVFDNRRNMISDDGLDIQQAADVKLKVKAVSLDANNKKTVVEVGDSDGEVRTLHRRSMSSLELKGWAEQELGRLKRDGLVGSFETFGAVIIDKLDTIGIVLDGVKRGTYQVKKNTITYGLGGFRQTIEVGDRLDGKG